MSILYSICTIIYIFNIYLYEKHLEIFNHHRFKAAVSGRWDYKLYIITCIYKFYIHCIRRSKIKFSLGLNWVSSADKWKVQM